jgi:hypothetical protein
MIGERAQALTVLSDGGAVQLSTHSGRRTDRIEPLFAAVHESAVGHFSDMAAMADDVRFGGTAEAVARPDSVIEGWLASLFASPKIFRTQMMIVSEEPLLAQSDHRREAGGQRSEINLFSYIQGVVHLNSEIWDGAFQLGVTKEKLDGTQVTSLPINLGGLRAAHRVCAVRF